MPRRAVRLLEAASGGLAAVLVFQVIAFLGEEGPAPLDTLPATRSDPSAAPLTVPEPGGAGGERPAGGESAGSGPPPPVAARPEGPPGPATSPGTGEASAAPQLPAPLRVIEERALFGRAPVKELSPVELLGIAGEHAFLRAPDGQVGHAPEGGTVGPVKVLRIGINRVLVEHDGKKVELTIFSGLGSAPLLPQEEARK